MRFRFNFRYDDGCPFEEQSKQTRTPTDKQIKDSIEFCRSFHFDQYFIVIQKKTIIQDCRVR